MDMNVDVDRNGSPKVDTDTNVGAGHMRRVDVDKEVHVGSDVVQERLRMSGPPLEVSRDRSTRAQVRSSLCSESGADLQKELDLRPLSGTDLRPLNTSFDSVPSVERFTMTITPIRLFTQGLADSQDIIHGLHVELVAHRCFHQSWLSIEVWAPACAVSGRCPGCPRPKNKDALQPRFDPVGPPS